MLGTDDGTIQPTGRDHPDAARRANQFLGRLEYTSGATRLTARPRFLIVELTRKCNLSCGMCRPAAYNRTAQSMPEAIFARIEAELLPYAEIADLRGWGESLILPKFEDRLARTVAAGAQVRVVSNLSFDRPSVIDSLVAAGAYVGASVDSADARNLRTVRGGARLALIERNLNRIAAGFERHGYGDRLNIYVTCQTPTLGQLADMVEFAARCGVFDVRFAPVSVDAASPLALPDDEQIMRDIFAEVAARAAKLGVKASLTASMTDRAGPKSGEAPCLHPWTHCYVSADGRIGFCDHLIGPEGDPYILGDLTTTAFDDIWNGADWVALRETHLGDRSASAPHFKECAWCYRNRYLDSETLLEPQLEASRVLAPGTHPA